MKVIAKTLSLAYATTTPEELDAQTADIINMITQSIEASMPMNRHSRYSQPGMNKHASNLIRTMRKT